jgi:hypothetical protein
MSPASTDLARERTRVAVIGAGPAGLAVSSRLRNLGIAHTLLEKGRLGESWRRMPSGLHLVSPWWTNALELRDVLRHPPFSMVSAQDYADYLSHFASRYSLKVAEGCIAQSIQRQPDEGGYLVLAEGREIACDAVVISTGYFSNPSGPSPQLIDDRSIPSMHAGIYPGASKLRMVSQEEPVLIIGRRISAGQLMTDLVDSGVSVALSAKVPVEFRQDGLFGKIKDFFYYFYEEVLLTMKPDMNAPSFPVMDGGRARELVEAGEVRVFNSIRQIKNGVVEFENGEKFRPGAIIHATGYSAALPDLSQLGLHLGPDGLPLCRDWQAVGADGIYLLGFDNRMNYRSRTLRGIRHDAAKLSKILYSRLSHSDTKVVARR